MNRLPLTPTAFTAVLILATLFPISAIAEDADESRFSRTPLLAFFESAARITVPKQIEIPVQADTIAMETRLGIPEGTLAVLEYQNNLPEGVLAQIARVESAGNPRARAKTSSAAGAYQWLNGSWKEVTQLLYGSSLDLDARYDPHIAAEVTAAWLGREWSRVVISAQDADLDENLGVYLVHFLGTRGAERFIQAYAENDQASASTVMNKKQMRANASVFYDNRGNVRTLKSVTDVISKRLAGGATVVSSGGVHQAKAVAETETLLVADSGAWIHSMFGRRAR